MTSSGMSSFAQNATIVLVHGAWADGSYWQNVILPLRKEGLKVTCAPIPLTSLIQDTAAERMGANFRSRHLDHSPMYTAPEVVVGVILEAARMALASQGPAAGS